MEKTFKNFIFPSLIIFLSTIKSSAAAATPTLLDKGFKANSGQPSATSFQPLLSDPTAVFSFGFLQTNSSNLDLAVIHLPSNYPMWRAIPSRPTGSASLSFNGSLLFADQKTGELLWSTPAISGDRIILQNSSNLQILKLSQPAAVLWQSFDFPSDTIVQDQNFTSNNTLFSPNQRFSMKLGPNYLALFMEFGQKDEQQQPMYWKRTALQAKNQIVNGEGPIYAQLSPLGFLGLYQKQNLPVDILSFDSFARGIQKFRRLTLENDGNLKAYYWNGSIWALDYSAISDLCALPNGCGAYGLCDAEEKRCGCVDNRSSGCLPAASGDFCGGGNDDFWVLRRKGVDLANKELISFVKVGSLMQCEGLCERNCSCWGAAYNNVSGYCYLMDYPIQTVVSVGDESKIGYFKVRMTENKGVGEGDRGRKTAEIVVVVGVLVAVAVAGVGFCWLVRRRRRRGGVDESMEGPYRDLNSSSFRSIEMVNSFRK